MTYTSLLACGLRAFNLVLGAADLLFEIGLKLLCPLVLGKQPEQFTERFEPEGGNTSLAIFFLSFTILRWKVRRHPRRLSAAIVEV